MMLDMVKLLVVLLAVVAPAALVGAAAVAGLLGNAPGFAWALAGALAAWLVLRKWKGGTPQA